MTEVQGFLSFPSDLWGWVTLIAADLAGIFAIISLVDKGRKQQVAEAQQLSKDIIEGLKTKVDLLEEQLEAQSSEIKILRNDLLKVTTENRTLREVLEGRDQSAVDYRKRGELSMEIVASTHKLVEENSEAIALLNKNIEKLFSAIEQHLKKLEEK